MSFAIRSSVAYASSAVEHAHSASDAAGDAARALEREVRAAGLGPERVGIAADGELIVVRYRWAEAHTVLPVLHRLLDFSGSAPSGRAYHGVDVRVVALIGSNATNG